MPDVYEFTEDQGPLFEMMGDWSRYVFDRNHLELIAKVALDRGPTPF
jgi:hypothetical protein